MIVSFSTKSSPTLERFLENFIEPKTFWKQLVHNFAYTTKEVTRVGDLVIMEMESLIDIIAQRAMILSVCAIFIGYILVLPWIVAISGITLMMSMFITSKVIRGILIKLDLKWHGHKEKIEFKSYTETILKLLHERRNKKLEE